MNSQKGGEFGFDILYFGKSTTSGEGNGNLFQYSCLENPHEQRSLAGNGPWDHKELDMTE